MPLQRQARCYSSTGFQGCEKSMAFVLQTHHQDRKNSAMELICLNIITRFNREPRGWGKDPGKQNTGMAQRTTEEPALKTFQCSGPNPPPCLPQALRGGAQNGHKQGPGGRWLRLGLRQALHQHKDAPRDLTGHCCVVPGGDLGSMNVCLTEQTFLSGTYCV